MPLLDQGFDPTDPSFDPAMLQRLLVANAATRAGQVGQLDPAQLPGAGTIAPAPSSFGILNGAAGGMNLPTALPPLGGGAVPLPPPDPRSAIPLPQPRPAFAPGAPGADAFAAAAPGGLPGLANGTAPAAADATQPAVPDSSLLGRIKQSISRLGDAIDTHPMTLMALGGGLAGAPSWGTGISRGLTAAAPASRLDMQYQLQQGGIQAAYGALQQHFVGQGDDPATAGRKALSLVYNPEWMKAFGPQIFGPTEPKTVAYKDANGIDRTAVYDPREQVLKDIQTGAPVGPRLGQAPGSTASAGGVASGTPGAAGASVPGAPAATAGNPAGTLAPAIMSRPGISPPLAPPPAGTGNVPAWQQGQIEAANAASAHARARAQGGEETIQKLTELESMVKDAPEDAFGTFAGSDEGVLSGRTVNRVASALAPGLSVYTPGGSSAKDLLSAHERLQGGYAGAIEPLARAIGGGDPAQSGGRMNTAILDQAKAIIGGTDTSDKETALQKLQDAKVRAWDGIQEGIRAGVYDPAKLPRANPETGVAMGRGAIWVDEAGNIRRNKI